MSDQPPASEEPDRGPRIRKLDDRIAYFQKNLEKLQRDQRRIPWLAFLLFLAIPGGYWWGAVGVLIVVVCVVFVLGSGFYLVWGHRTEYQSRIAKLQAERRRL